MARQQSRASILRELADAQKKLEAHDRAQAERIGRIAIKTGLTALDISEARLTEELQAVVARFRGGADKLGEETQTDDGDPDGGGGGDEGSADPIEVILPVEPEPGADGEHGAAKAGSKRKAAAEAVDDRAG